MPRIRLIATLVAGCCLAAGPAQAQDSGPRTIAVTGSATISAPNDTAGFTTGAGVRRATAGAALRGASAVMRRVIAALEAHGVAARDIRTEHVGVQRVVRHSRHRRIVSYLATNSVSVIVRSIQRAGSLIDAAVGAGATRVSGPSFWRSSTAGLYQQALVKALRKARAKAQALATDSGETLGSVQSIAESGAEVQAYGDSASSKATAPGTPVQPGHTTVTADLTAVFAIA